MKRLLIFMTFVALTTGAWSCGKTPPSLSTTGGRYYQADRGIVAIGTVQHVAIALNGVSVCDPAPCHPLLSDANTRVVVDASTDALKTIQVSPGGWKVTVGEALEYITARLDAAGKAELASYLEAARVIVTTF